MMNSSLQSPQIDEAAIREHLALIHGHATALANGHDRSVLLLTAIYPDGNPVISRFEIGDIEGMCRVAVASAEGGSNVYVEGRTLRPDLNPGSRGTLESLRFRARRG